MKNKLICFGYTGDYVCFLNMSREEAFEQFKIQEKEPNLNIENINLIEFEFENSFGVYDAWKSKE